jgi:hypothetical protein
MYEFLFRCVGASLADLHLLSDPRSRVDRQPLSPICPFNPWDGVRCGETEPT